MQHSRVLVTGAGGFTGRFVVEELLSRGVPVRALVRRDGQLQGLESNPLLEVARGDLVDERSLEPAVRGCSGIIHIAALFRQAGLPESEFNRVNVEGTRSLVDLAEKHGVSRFIHCSTVGVHGHIENPPGDELTPFVPGDMYQRSKLAGELLVHDAFESGRLSGIIIRPAMIYGPGDQRTLKLFRMISQGTFFYVGPGTAKVHFVDVRDLARAFYLALMRQDVSNEAVIVAGSLSFELRDFVKMVATVFHVRPPWLHLPVRPMQMLGSLCETVCTPLRINPPLYRRRVDFYTKHREFDFSKARQLLDYAPQREALDEIIDIIDSYVTAGLVRAPLVHAPVELERTFDGSITSWGEATAAVYGWEPRHAIGKVSHALFETVFPTPLSRINAALQEQRRWVGRLVHRCSDGRRIDVISRWELLESRGRNAVVRETNRVVEPALRSRRS